MSDTLRCPKCHATTSMRCSSCHVAMVAVPDKVGPRIERAPIPESSDFDEVCSVCGQMVSGPHSWQQCAEGLAAIRDAPCQECGSLMEMLRQAEAERDAAIRDRAKPAASVGTAGDKCGYGNECGRPGCPECQA